jgi:hypothetical protein
VARRTWTENTCGRCSVSREIAAGTMSPRIGTEPNRTEPQRREGGRETPPCRTREEQTRDSSRADRQRQTQSSPRPAAAVRGGGRGQRASIAHPRQKVTTMADDSTAPSMSKSTSQTATAVGANSADRARPAAATRR